MESRSRIQPQANSRPVSEVPKLNPIVILVEWLREPGREVANKSARRIASYIETMAKIISERDTRIEKLEKGLKPFAAIRTADHPDAAIVSVSIDFTRDEVLAYNAEIERDKLPVKKAGVDLHALDAGMNWPKHILSLDGLTLRDFRQAHSLLYTERKL